VGLPNNHGAFANVGFFGFWWKATEMFRLLHGARTMGAPALIFFQNLQPEKERILS